MQSSGVDLFGLESLQPMQATSHHTTSAVPMMMNNRGNVSPILGMSGNNNRGATAGNMNVMGGGNSSNNANSNGMKMNSNSNTNLLGLNGSSSGISSSSPGGMYDPFSNIAGLQPSRGGAMNNNSSSMNNRR